MYPKQMDRRKGPDIWVRFLNVGGVTVWIIATMIYILVGLAKPEMESFFNRYLPQGGVALRSYWDLELLKLALYLSMLQLILCLFSLLINKKRHRRKNDSYRWSFFIMSAISVIMIIFCLTKIF